MTTSAAFSVIDTAAAVAQLTRRSQDLPLSELATANRQRDALYLLSEQLHRAGSVEAICTAAMDSIESALIFSSEPHTHTARLWHAKSQQFRLCAIRATALRNEDGSVCEWVGACTEAPAASHAT